MTHDEFLKLFNRRFIGGYDLNTKLLNNNYPPHNIELLEDGKYLLTMAIAGFTREEVTIKMENDRLEISGKKNNDGLERTFLHQGIADREFTKTFNLMEHIKVISAEMKNGLLYINLEKIVPEDMKPKYISIS